MNEILAENTNTRNFSNSCNGGKLIHMYTVKERISTTVFMEVPADIDKNIRDNNIHILVTKIRSD